jgi:hypothetical protein
VPAKKLGELPTLAQKLAVIRHLAKTEAGGNPGQFLAQTDVLRGAREGSPNQRLAQMLATNEDQALADRYGWGGDIAKNSMVGPLALAPAVGYEAVKAMAPGALGVIGKFLPQGDEMQVSSNTSKPSIANILALLQGYRDAS